MLYGGRSETTMDSAALFTPDPNLAGLDPREGAKSRMGLGYMDDFADVYGPEQNWGLTFDWQETHEVAPPATKSLAGFGRLFDWQQSSDFNGKSYPHRPDIYPVTKKLGRLGLLGQDEFVDTYGPEQNWGMTYDWTANPPDIGMPDLGAPAPAPLPMPAPAPSDNWDWSGTVKSVVTSIPNVLRDMYVAKAAPKPATPPSTSGGNTGLVKKLASSSIIPGVSIGMMAAGGALIYLALANRRSRRRR